MIIPMKGLVFNIKTEKYYNSCKGNQYKQNKHRSMSKLYWSDYGFNTLRGV